MSFKEDNPPTGMSDEEMEKFDSLCAHLFDLYNKMPPEGMPRKVVAALDSKTQGNALILFRGDSTDLVKIHNILYEPPE